MQRPPTKHVANIPPGVGADSSRPYPDIIKYTYPFHHTRILTSSNTHIRITEYVYTHYQMHIFTSPNTCIQITTHVFSHHHIRISVSHFVGIFVYAGTINRPLRLLVVCHNAANGLLIMQRPPTKYVANIPPGVGADSSRPYPNIIKCTYSYYRIRVYTPSNMCFHFDKCVYPNHHARGFTSPHTHFRLSFRGCFRICGHDKSVPYGC